MHTPRFGGDASSGRRESVAATLRRARERHGQDVRSIAQVLRIRQPYLEALESGQYDRLPGIAYAIGFLRSYADFLGLNATDLIDRFKEEAQGAERRTELVFPEPVAEGRIPGGAVILISVVLLGVAYGGWFYLSNQGRTVADLIPALPEQLQTLIDSESDAPAQAPSPAAPVPDVAVADAAPASPAAAPTPEQAPTPEPATTAQPAPTQAMSAEPVPEVEQTAEVAPPPPAPATPEPRAMAPETPAAPEPSARQSAPPSEPAWTAVPEASPDVRALPAEAAQIAGLPPSDDTVGATDAFSGSMADSTPPAAVAPAPEPERQLTLLNPDEAANTTDTSPIIEETVVIPAPPAPPAPPPSFAAPGERQPRTYGESNEAPRIVLRALQDSWVQVRDAQDALLLTRVLRTGDTYQVPNQPGLTLLTGNAGGIEIEVDGVTLPPLGPVGAVRRQIALDPALLTGGVSRQ